MVSSWLFAYEYLRMSYKTKLKNSGKPADTDKIVFDAINYLECFLIVILNNSFNFPMCSFLVAHNYSKAKKYKTEHIYVVDPHYRIFTCDFGAILSVL